MSRTLYSRRLAEDERDVWLSLARKESSVQVDAEMIDSFMSLKNSLFYIASFDDDLFGGTAAFIDDTRLAMAFVDVIISPEFIDNALYSLIKSSMPFFRSVAIRDIDAIVNTQSETNELPFPLNVELEIWSKETLEKLGFSEIGDIRHVTCRDIENISSNECNIIWKTEVDIDKIRTLYWNRANIAGLAFSQFWLHFEFTMARKHLRTVIINDEVVAVAGFTKYNERLVVSPILHNSEVLESTALVDSLLQYALKDGARVLDFPILGTGQKMIGEVLELKSKSELSIRDLKLFRKNL